MAELSVSYLQKDSQGKEVFIVQAFCSFVVIKLGSGTVQVGERCNAYSSPSSPSLRKSPLSKEREHKKQALGEDGKFRRSTFHIRKVLQAVW